jgi:hypothetical protein
MAEAAAGDKSTTTEGLRMAVEDFGEHGGGLALFPRSIALLVTGVPVGHFHRFKIQVSECEFKA